MKTILGMIFSLATFLPIASYVPPIPGAIKVSAPTEQTIKEEMKREQKEKQYKRAIAAARMVYRNNRCRAIFAEATGRVAVDYGLSPRLLAGLVFVESSCNPNAVSGQKSVGLTQVNPVVWKFKNDELLDPEKNLRIGASILSAYIRKFGLVEGLHHYNGMGGKAGDYSTKVLSAAGLS
jgi:soluble lytic murein transglycosylase-like protein